MPALELDVEKISDNYKIVPYSENPDFYLGQLPIPAGDNKNLNMFQNILRSKSPDVNKSYWKFKTRLDQDDSGIAEELILADKLDVGKYVKKIILEDRIDYGCCTNDLIDLIKEKYPQIEIVIADDKNYIR